MELFSFWVINPADGQDGKPEPVKISFFENGDINIISLSGEPDFWGAYKMPCGSYSYTGDTLTVSEENLAKVVLLIPQTQDIGRFQEGLFVSGLINQREWDLFYENKAAWKSLRIVAIKFGNG